MAETPTPTPSRMKLEHRLDTASPRRQLDLYAALRSTLRAWLVSRDSVIWLLVAGESAQSGGAILSPIDPAQFALDSTPSFERMNQLRHMAYDFAAQISQSSAESVVRAELDALMKDEAPKFVLAVDGIPGAF